MFKLGDDRRHEAKVVAFELFHQSPGMNDGELNENL
jgi:hypothetical protein